MRSATEEWLTAARDDLETVGEIINNPRLTHVVTFHVQQCIEKGFKAVRSAEFLCRLQNGNATSRSRNGAGHPWG